MLPLLGGQHGGRSSMTCLYRCGNACDHPVPNTSANEYFGDVVAAEVSRRGLLQAAGAGAVVIGLAGTAVAATAEPVLAHGTSETQGWRHGHGPRPLTFTSVPPNRADAITVPDGYAQRVVIRWGDPVLPGAPAFDVHNQTVASQERQFGYNNDFVAVLPLDGHKEHCRSALLVANHEYTNEELIFPGFTGHDALTVEQLKIAISAHGLSIVEIERIGHSGAWRLVTHGRRPYNRRISALTTKFAVTGPAAGTASLKTAADPTGRKVIGTLNNCAGGVTPWGTILSGEENYNQYFVGADGAPAEAKESLARYGFATTTRYPSGSRKWDRADARFDLAVNPNEANRFGWIVEIDPTDPDSTPRKHTALGRFKHEAATIEIAKDGRAVAYMGDDERFDYLYKFVSHKKYRPGQRKHNLTLLESGDLFVAKLSYSSPESEIDGTGTLPSDGAFNGGGVWLPLVKDGVSKVPGMTVEQVLVHTRLAADKIGPTKMDRPEDVQPSPVTGRVYVALTNNTARAPGAKASADEANPRNNNKHGHILELIETHNDAAALTFTWSIPIVCGDPADPKTYFAGFDKTKVSPISCPDNLAFDPSGNLWISTDGNALRTPEGLSLNDGIFATPLSGPEAGHVKQFLSVPYGAEACGPVVTEDGRSVFVAVQHPGEIAGATVENPASRWPDGDFARPAVAVAWRPDGRPAGV
ncbi:secreted PhoX family phosphatase [Allocatelliglobosispora scoriae]|uniref:Secreted PhoX family phosphatase n=2 Tax=Allocatelliglobosispora scoriae TaxID=643052 RepID=A0A841BWJ9_9ACTN|nr:secreted PhoX family phosphatase [Allocatelliglobosispora scoriae]